MQSGIYQILNLITNEKYIGSSKNLKNRKSQHFTSLRRNVHNNLHLQNAFNKHGEQNFRFEILASNIPIEDLIDLEQLCLDVTQPEYNKRTIAHSNQGLEPWNKGGYSDSMKQSLITRYGKKIVCYNLEGKFVKFYDSLSQAARELEVTVGAVVSNLKGHSKTCGSYVFNYYNENDFQEKIEIHTRYTYSRFNNLSATAPHPSGKRVGLINGLGETIATYSSVVQAANENGFRHHQTLRNHITSGKKHNENFFVFLNK